MDRQEDKSGAHLSLAGTNDLQNQLKTPGTDETEVSISATTTKGTGRGTLEEPHQGGRATTTCREGLTTGRDASLTGRDGAKGKSEGFGCKSQAQGKGQSESTYERSNSQSQGRREDRRAGAGTKSPETASSRRGRGETWPGSQDPLGGRTYLEGCRDRLGVAFEGEGCGLRGGQILSPGVQGGRGSPECPGVGGSDGLEDPAQRHDRRGSVESPVGDPALGTESSVVRRRLHARSSRRGFGPWDTAQEAARGGSRRSVGRQSPEGGAHRAGRRVGGFEEGDGKAGASRSNGREGQRQREEGQEDPQRPSKRPKREEGEGEGESQAEEIHKSGYVLGGYSPGWEPCQGCSPEDPKEALSGNGHGPLRQGPQQGHQIGQKICQEKRSEKFVWIAELVRKFTRRERRGRWRHDLPASCPGERGSGIVPRSSSVPGVEPDEIELAPIPRRGGKEFVDAGCGSPVLPASLAAQGDGCRSSRTLEPMRGGGLPSEIPPCSGAGSSDPAHQERRVHPRWNSLDSEPEVGTTAGRAGHLDGHGRDERSPKDSCGGVESKMAEFSPRRKAPDKSKGGRKREEPWQGRWSQRGRHSQGRKGLRRQRRLEEKRRCRRSKGQLRSQAEAEHEEAGAGSPGQNSTTGTKIPEQKPATLEGDRIVERPYEEGSAQALSVEDMPKSSSQGQYAGLDPYQALVQSMLVAAPPFEEAAGPNGLQQSLVAEDERFDCDRRGVKKCFRQLSWDGCFLRDCGMFLFEELLGVLPLRSQNMGRRDSSGIFPLPTSRSLLSGFLPELSEAEWSWLSCVVISLNSLWGDMVVNETSLNEGQQACLREICKDVKRFVGVGVIIPELDWADLFSVRAIDYKGDEVKVAKWFSWENVEPALPGDVGSVPLEAVCSRGCRDYVLNFDLYLKPRNQWVVSKAPRVMVHDDAWADVCRGLVSRGVCEFILEEDVFKTDSGPLLNGMFGVAKDETTPEGVDIFRLIMNLIPLNGLCKPLSGDIDTLPAWSAMSPFFLQPNESLLVSSEDVKCFFYTMSVPVCWRKFLAFNKLVPEAVLPGHLQGCRVYLSSCVLPMGFLNSVSLAQHVHRNLVKWSALEGAPDSEGTNNPESELRKDQGFTCHNPSWRVYLDNYDLLEKVSRCEVNDLEGTQ